MTASRPAGPEPAASAEEIAALLRVDFASFAQAAFAELYPQTRFAPAWHLELIAAIPGTARKSLPRRRPGAGRPGRRRWAGERSAG